MNNIPVVKAGIVAVSRDCFPMLDDTCTVFFFFSDDESLSAKDAPDVGTANTGASKTLTASDAVKDLAPAADADKEATVLKKKAKKSNADKGVVIISDNPSGPPLDDVSFLFLLVLL